jgi:mannose-1-phosphate guanylyltransferase
MYDSDNCIVKLPEGKVAVLQGLKDYVVVDDNNVLVVCPKKDQGAIRKFVNDVQLIEGDDFI